MPGWQLSQSNRGAATQSRLCWRILRISLLRRTELWVKVEGRSKTKWFNLIVNFFFLIVQYNIYSSVFAIMSNSFARNCINLYGFLNQLSVFFCQILFWIRLFFQQSTRFGLVNCFLFFFVSWFASIYFLVFQCDLWFAVSFLNFWFFLFGFFFIFLFCSKLFIRMLNGKFYKYSVTVINNRLIIITLIIQLIR